MTNRHFKEVLSGERPLIDVWHYLIGQLRFKIYYSKIKFLRKLIRSHILVQIKWRIEVMDRDCFYNGTCKKCGCETTALQMASKSCEKPCYPRIMNKEEWKQFEKGGFISDVWGRWTISLMNRKPILIRWKDL